MKLKRDLAFYKRKILEEKLLKENKLLRSKRE
jgi:hypothetical protein